MHLEMHRPCGGIAHNELTFERERRQLSLGLADQIDGEKPRGQGQFGADDQRIGGDRGLEPTGTALLKGLGAATENAMGRGRASRTIEPNRPARSRERVCAVRLGAKGPQEFQRRPAGMSLNGAACNP